MKLHGLVVRYLWLDIERYTWPRNKKLSRTAIEDMAAIIEVMNNIFFRSSKDVRRKDQS